MDLQETRSPNSGQWVPLIIQPWASDACHYSRLKAIFMLSMIFVQLFIINPTSLRLDYKL
ncbi:hypothetical protein ASPBRDRAFT_41583 [Aspergillus brasiliensis CBS 101740]|uniref:Uncharacterized protein n=1 Tax=Aspergillus brasiliensis (strain CBS 101740 / IMI 381727 / IBT 21946) TaxID=767769 RepID=A0A1L9UQ85_ASPBC|nr:hypothetical protein ASPBRDRAFT_41583 [Aspergillus brasiliensis CBS 101740]